MRQTMVSLAVLAAFTLGICSSLQAQSPSSGSSSSSKPSPTSKLEQVTKGMKKVEGLWTMYHNDQKLYVMLKTADLSKEYLVLTSIAKGVSTGNVLGGMSWGFGDDALWSFRKVGEKIHVLRKNVKFRAKAGTPEKDAVSLAYGDSVLYALPVVTSISGGYLVDMTRIFMSDDQGIGRSIGFSFASDRSTWAKVKSFPRNIELQVAAVYAGSRKLETVADPRGIQVNVHYSISLLEPNGYKPRAADDRVGYFLTAVKDFSNDDDPEHFVRYINRWDLQKEDPAAKLSRPKKPIRFYIEKTVPRELRPYVQEGIEEWNKAYEKLGFYKAIEVFQQREEDDWDPEDVRYNTFRWITAEAGFAMGPSRVNPRTGQILDADIIFDDSFLRYWSQDFETFSPETARDLIRRPGHNDGEVTNIHSPGEMAKYCRLSHGMQQQMGFSAAVLMARGVANAEGKLPMEFVQQALKEVVMHEVGHTLGLRHNFKASTWKSMKDIDDGGKGRTEGIVASVMDYTPANISPDKEKQGLYYTQTIGPYDYWAIEYGYKPISGNEKEELAKIASRSAAPGHDYATDEDTRGFDPDPLTNRFDLGENPINFVDRQMKLAASLLPEVVDRAGKDGDGYQRVRQMFGMLFSEYWRSAAFAARFPGGVLVHRDHKGDKDARAPFEVVPADQQRQAMKLLGTMAFGSPDYDAETLNYLAASRWSHWGASSTTRLDYPIHDNVLMMQSMLLIELMDPSRLQRLLDNELKVADDADAYTLAEHMRLMVEPIFAEWKSEPKAAEFSNRKPYVSSFRRNLQRVALKQMASAVTRGSLYPEDARTLSRMHLQELGSGIDRILKSKVLKLDDYSKAHLMDSRNRIRQVLEADLTVQSVN